MNRLQQFYLDEATREEVKEFMISFLEEKTIEKVFGGSSVVGILEAKDMINGSFSRLEELYKIKKDKAIETNE